MTKFKIVLVPFFGGDHKIVQIKVDSTLYQEQLSFLIGYYHDCEVKKNLHGSICFCEFKASSSG